jgi:hypothetical protein
MNDVLAKHRQVLDVNYCRVDQLRRTYAEVPDADFYGAFMSRAPEGLEASIAAVVQAFGSREFAPMRTRTEIESEEGPAIRVRHLGRTVRRTSRSLQ